MSVYREGPNKIEELDRAFDEAKRLLEKFREEFRLSELENIVSAAKLQLDGPEVVETNRQLLAIQNHLKVLAESMPNLGSREPISPNPDGNWICANDVKIVEPWQTAVLSVYPESNPMMAPRSIMFTVEDSGVQKPEQYDVRILNAHINKYSLLDKWRAANEENPTINGQSSAIFGRGKLMRIGWPPIEAIRPCEITIYNPHPMTMRVEVTVFGDPPPPAYPPMPFNPKYPQRGY